MSNRENFLAILGLFSSASAVIPLLIWLLKYKDTNLLFKPILTLVITNFAVEFYSVVTVINFELNNMAVFHFFTVIEFLLINFFYRNFFAKFLNPNIFLVIGFVFILIAFIDYEINGLKSLNNFSVIIECLILTTYSLVLFYFVIKNLQYENLLDEPVFWINSAVLFYFAGNLLFFTFINYVLAENREEHNFLWSTTHTFFNITYNVFLAISIWKARRK